MKDKIRAILNKLYESAFEDSVKSPYLAECTGYGVEEALRDIEKKVEDG